ncbi:hypothetical protein EV361DRAFT_922502 [Lentinula raphanica]|nr:hypothetical protein EV361DRAFT_922502 [Lentinula raphanica]
MSLRLRITNGMSSSLGRTFERKLFLNLDGLCLNSRTQISLLHRKEILLHSTTQLIKRLHKLQSLVFFQNHWGLLSLELKEALMQLVNQPSLARINLLSFYIPSLQNLTSLLSQASHLKMLKVQFLYCLDWALLTPLNNRSAPPRYSNPTFVPRSRNKLVCY